MQTLKTVPRYVFVFLFYMHELVQANLWCLPLDRNGALVLNSELAFSEVSVVKHRIINCSH
jgi:hypothetical protein